MKTIQTTVFEFDELSDSAKEKARDWYRQGALDYDWWDSTYDDAERIGLKLTSFDLDRNRHACGHFLNDAAEVAKAIIREHGDKCETHKTAKAFLTDLDKLNADCEAEDGHDETNVLFEEWQDKRETLKGDFLKSILEDYAILLQDESEYLMSDEAVDETIRANEYTFTKDGTRF